MNNITVLLSALRVCEIPSLEYVNPMGVFYGIRKGRIGWRIYSCFSPLRIAPFGRNKSSFVEISMGETGY